MFYSPLVTFPFTFKGFHSQLKLHVLKYLIPEEAELLSAEAAHRYSSACAHAISTDKRGFQNLVFPLFRKLICF